MALRRVGPTVAAVAVLVACLSIAATGSEGEVRSQAGPSEERQILSSGVVAQRYLLRRLEPDSRVISTARLRDLHPESDEFAFVFFTLSHIL